MRKTAVLLVALAISALARAQVPVGDAMATIRTTVGPQSDRGTPITQDAVLSTSANSYTLRYSVIELPDAPDQVGCDLWAFTIGYIPLGLPGPSDAGWYWQGFITWTFDDLNLKDWRAQARVVRDFGQDAMVEYVWDTPRVRAVARFAMTAGSDKLLFFGRYEPKTEIRECKLRLMAYPATFSQPWQRSVTTSARTLTTGDGVPLNLDTERWVLLEDTLPGRPADGSCGLLLGDASAFASVTLSGIGGYAQYVDLTLKPERRDFALGLYEFPAAPDPEQTREYFRRIADSESDALARLNAGDLDQPLAPLPVDTQRLALTAEEEQAQLGRPAETWRPSREPLAFPWAERMPDQPVRVALLCARWSAFETMELARRVAMEVTHLYFDGKGVMVDPDFWPYRANTGIGPLNAGVAQRHALRICSDPGREVILVAGLRGEAIPQQVRRVIMEQVRAGKGLLITGDASALGGWPPELTANPDDTLVAEALESIPWASLPGLEEGGRGRVGDDSPLRGYRYGEGRVIVFSARLGEYSSLIPVNDASEGLEGGTDRLLALHARALLAAAGRRLPIHVRLTPPENLPQAAVPGELLVQASGGEARKALVRVQDDLDDTLLLETRTLDPERPVIALPPLPAGRRCFVDVLLRDQADACVGYASVALQGAAAPAIRSLALTPGERVHPQAVLRVDLTEGGPLRCEATVTTGPDVQSLTLRCEVWDSVGRLVARSETPVSAEGAVVTDLMLPRPVTVCHQLDARLMSGSAVLAHERVRFTVPMPFPYDDFTLLMWSYPGGEPVIQRENRLCYEMGADMMDLCHMRGFTDAGAAREYALAARSGLRLVPYVSRIAGTSRSDNTLDPGLFDPAMIEREVASITVCTRQAAPYRPAAYTLGDENYLSDGRFEVDVAPQTMDAFRAWLEARYGDIDALNATWRTTYGAFAEITRPMLLENAAEQTESFAAWFDHKDFMDSAFAELHEKFAEVIADQDPEAKVGWDGLLGYHWQAGYDFDKLTRHLALNQVYTASYPQGDLVASLKRSDALTGEWMNAIADQEEGFSAIPWHNLFKGHNSCWWWTSWGCDYIPFNPDTSVSAAGEWYFRSAREIKSGIGRLLVGATRDDSRIAILYNQADMYAAVLASRLAPESCFAGDHAWLANHIGLLRALEDLGYSCRYVAASDVEADPGRLQGYRVLVLPLATCISDRLAESVRVFATGGGTVIADGRVGLLTGNGMIRSQRALEALFGVTAPAGLQALTRRSQSAEVETEAGMLRTQLLEPDLSLNGGTAALTVGNTPILVSNNHGRGRGLLLNLPFQLLGETRGTASHEAALSLLGSLLEQAGVHPHASLSTSAGLPRCTKQSQFVDGDLRYLGLEQDILLPGRPPQEVMVTISSPAFVYDMRAGRQVGRGLVSSWEIHLSRGRPLLFSLLPYEVRAVHATAPGTARAGETVKLGVMLDVTPPPPQRHVVWLGVYAPGSDQPHRQYSQSIECPGGEGEATIPFALNDPAGTWRLELRDVASGVKTTAYVVLEN